VTRRWPLRATEEREKCDDRRTFRRGDDVAARPGRHPRRRGGGDAAGSRHVHHTADDAGKHRRRPGCRTRCSGLGAQRDERRDSRRAAEQRSDRRRLRASPDVPGRDAVAGRLLGARRVRPERARVDPRPHPAAPRWCGDARLRPRPDRARLPRGFGASEGDRGVGCRARSMWQARCSSGWDSRP
jgi:hypothetical protein